LLDSLRNWLATYKLQSFINKQSNSTTIANFNIDNVKTIVVLFDATLVSDVDLIKKLIEYYKQQHKVIKAIGYINKKEFEPIILPKTEFEFFSAKELNFDYSPKTNWHEQFINYGYDLVINADYNNTMPLNYLYAHSKAKFKLAVESPLNTTISNITIDISKENNLKYFLRHTDHYLQLINKK
jgi:hypothetical protein